MHFLPDIGAPSKDIYFLNVSISSNDTNILEFIFLYNLDISSYNDTRTDVLLLLLDVPIVCFYFYSIQRAYQYMYRHMTYTKYKMAYCIERPRDHLPSLRHHHIFCFKS